jgi:hypothetical protein
MKLKTSMILTLAVIAIGAAYAGVGGTSDACDGLAIFLVWNDTLHTTELTAPSGVTVMTGCPPDLYVFPDTMPQLHYPDTLVWADTIIAKWQESGDMADGTPCSTTVPGQAYYNSVSGTDPIQIPPAYNPNCCKEGIYAKARMFDNASGQYSPWVDINTTDQFLVNYVPGFGLVLQLSLDNFKKRDLSDAMGFDCNVDTLILYVWDCDNADIAGTAGEFGVVYKTFPNGEALGFGNNTVYLNRYQNCAVGVEEKPQVPQAYSLEQNQPNPFNSVTQIRYALPEDATVKIEITNILGNKVRTLVDGRETAGYKRVVWNGLDDAGKEVPSGVYFYTIRANDFTARNRAILMK